MTKEIVTKSYFVGWPTVEGKVIGQLFAALGVFTLLLNSCFKENGLRGLAHTLKEKVEIATEINKSKCARTTNNKWLVFQKDGSV